MKRVLLKLSGEALAGDKKTGFDEACIPLAYKAVEGFRQDASVRHERLEKIE